MVYVDGIAKQLELRATRESSIIFRSTREDSSRKILRKKKKKLKEKKNTCTHAEVSHCVGRRILGSLITRGTRFVTRRTVEGVVVERQARHGARNFYSHSARLYVRE